MVTKRRYRVCNLCVSGSKIRFLLQAGYRVSLHSVPRCKEEDEKNIKVYSASLAALSSRAAGGGRKSFFFLGRGWRLDSPFWWQTQKAKSFLLEILLNWGASQIAKAFSVLLACDFRVGVFIENANAKAEDACFREKMSGATAERLFALGGPKGY